MRRYDLFKKEIILTTSLNDRFRTYKNYIEYNFFPLSNEGEERDRYLHKALQHGIKGIYPIVRSIGRHLKVLPDSRFLRLLWLVFYRRRRHLL